MPGDSSEQSSVLVHLSPSLLPSLLFHHRLNLLRLQSSLEKIHFLFIVFHLEYTVIKRPNGIRSRIPGNQSSLEYNIYIIRSYFLFIIFLSFVLFYDETHFYGHLFSFSFIILFLINIPRYYLCLRILLFFLFHSFLHPRAQFGHYAQLFVKINRNDHVVETQYYSVTQNVMHKFHWLFRNNCR